MFVRSALLAVFLVFPGMALAQDVVIKDFSSPQVEKFIKEVLKTEVKKKEVADDLVFYDTPDGQFDIFLRSGDAKAVVFQYPHATLKVPLTKLNEWNGKGNFTHAFADKSGKAVLAASLSLENGLTYRQFTSFYARIQQERLAFAKLYNPPEE